MFFKIIVSLIIISSLLAGCKKNTDTNVAFNDLQNNLIEKANFKNTELENLKDITIAQEYGIATEDIESGFVYSSKNETADKLILVKAKDNEAIEKVEKALANKVSGLISTWSDTPSESEKLKEHVLKTKDNFVLLVVSENSEVLEDEFDNHFV